MLNTNIMLNILTNPEGNFLYYLQNNKLLPKIVTRVTKSVYLVLVLSVIYVCIYKRTYIYYIIQEYKINNLMRTENVVLCKALSIK